jgi:hypothetical protein
MTARVTPETISFVMAGCQRCGTTWVDAALRDHPQIFLPAQKQTYFFDENYDRGIDWYLEQFDGIGPEQSAVGEISTGYCLPHAAPLLARHLPHVKLIMAMRHPVDRAYSNFQVRKAVNDWPTFEDAIERSPDLLDRGRYIEQIEALLEHFPRERLLCVLYDDLKNDDRAYLRSILTFLEVDADFQSSEIGKKRNATMFPRLRKVLHRMGLKPMLAMVSRSPVGDVVRRSNKKRGRSSSATMNPDTRARLIEYFRPANERLASFLDRDLSAWNR